MAAIRLEAVSLERNGAPILDGLDLEVGEGEIFALIGPSGSGKTAILRLIAGLQSPSRGRVRIGDQLVDVAQPWRNGVAMVFQGDALYEHLSVGGNLTFPLLAGGASSGRAEREARRRVRGLGLERLWKRRPATLSGGERGMVATGRALSRQHLTAVLFDEPVAMADRQVRLRFRSELRRLHAETGLTMVLASNDQEEALAVADRVGVIDGGKLLQVASPRTLYLSPANLSVAGFVGDPPMNLIPCRAHRKGDRWWLEVGADQVTLPVGLPEEMDGRRVVVGLHPAEIRLAPPGTPFEEVVHATVAKVDDLGSSTIVRFGLGANASPAFSFLGGEGLEPGRPVELVWAGSDVRIFDPETGDRIGAGREGQR